MPCPTRPTRPTRPVRRLRHRRRLRGACGRDRARRRRVSACTSSRPGRVSADARRRIAIPSPASASTTASTCSRGATSRRWRSSTASVEPSPALALESARDDDRRARRQQRAGAAAAAVADRSCGRRARVERHQRAGSAVDPAARSVASRDGRQRAPIRRCATGSQQHGQSAGALPDVVGTAGAGRAESVGGGRAAPRRFSRCCGGCSAPSPTPRRCCCRPCRSTSSTRVRRERFLRGARVDSHDIGSRRGGGRRRSRRGRASR